MNREVRQRASTHEFDRIVVYGERNSPVGSSKRNGFVETIGSGSDQDDSQRC